MKADLTFVWNGLQCVGSRFPLQLPKLVVLNSAQNKQPTGADSWIEGSLEALEAFAGAGWTLLSSTGMNTWELMCWAGGTYRYAQIVAVLWNGLTSPEKLFKALLCEFDLREEFTLVVLLESPGRKFKAVGPHRDKLLLGLADKVLPVSVRKGGKLDVLLGLTKSRLRADNQFVREWQRKPARTQYHFDIPAIQSGIDPSFSGWVVHWTRAAQGPWPGETRAVYYRDVVQARSEYARSAARTLRRIIEEKRIRASSWRIRGGEGVVCFSALLPSEATQLMRWRARFVRFSVEPFGIALSPQAVDELGIQPVLYMSHGERAPAGTPASILQAMGGSGDWPREKEFRHRGDVNLGPSENCLWKAVDLSGHLL